MSVIGVSISWKQGEIPSNNDKSGLPGTPITQEITTTPSQSSEYTSIPITPPIKVDSLSSKVYDKEELGIMIKSSAGWENYNNTEIGFQISYPKKLLEKGFMYASGDAGQTLFATFRFPSGRHLAIVTRTSDYASGRERNWGETMGYVKENGKYYIGPSRESDVKPTDLWEIDGGKDKAIVLYEKDLSAPDYYVPELLVIANSPNKSFPGIGFEVNRFDATTTISLDEIAIVKKMVNSIKFNK